MAGDTIITIEKLGKRYQLGASQNRESYTALRDVLAREARSLFRRRNEVESKEEPTEFWALRDVSFEIQRGEVVGIIGRNGAGKSTLLKILSRITEPTSGRISLRGRVASLLEVGTGFHPELTGRENIFLNGAILGMHRTEIKAKFDEIVAFAEVEKFLDTPVKRYSSGMYVRLAFAVAAHLEPEILVVDEVLAVGDARFQSKCLGKMQDIAHKGHRTVLFVSHNMGSVMELCDRCLLLSDGRVLLDGTPKEATTLYAGSTGSIESSLLSKAFRGTLNTKLKFTSLQATNEDKAASDALSSEDRIKVLIEATCYEDIPDFRTTFSVFAEGARLFSMHDVDSPLTLKKGNFSAEFILPEFLLRPGVYTVAIGGHSTSTSEWIWGTDLMNFTILEAWGEFNSRHNHGLVNVKGAARRIP